MFKKVVKGIAIGAALVGIAAGSAPAKDLEINIYGGLGPAQVLAETGTRPFWATPTRPAATWSTATLLTRSTAWPLANKCDITATDADKIIIRYSSRASYDGINAVLGKGATRDMCNTADNCQTLVPVPVNLGASDVNGKSFTQSTRGWEDGISVLPQRRLYCQRRYLEFPHPG